MSTTSSGIRVWFDLARAGNFPSVASNVLAALVLSAAVAAAPGTAGFPPIVPLLLAIAASCLVYAGGATFNDVADAGFDARHRPDRAIPRGAVTRAGAAWVAGAQMVAGLGGLVALDHGAGLLAMLVGHRRDVRQAIRQRHEIEAGAADDNGGFVGIA